MKKNSQMQQAINEKRKQEILADLKLFENHPIYKDFEQLIRALEDN